MKNNGFFTSLADFFFVRKCIVCDDVLWEKGEMCGECRKLWESARLSRCGVCGKTARACSCRPPLLTATKKVGDRYLTAPVFFGKADSEDKKDILVRRTVTLLKKSADRRCVRFAAKEISADLLRFFLKNGEDTKDWVICYPPRTGIRRREFGFDHGKELSHEISRYTGIPVEDILCRRGQTMQKGLRLPERAASAKAALYLKKGSAPDGRKYIIADDIITTGATVNAAADLLLSAGAEAVFPVALARTKKKKRTAKRKPSDRPWFIYRFQR